jgi:hypothetical protein
MKPAAERRALRALALRAHAAEALLQGVVEALRSHAGSDLGRELEDAEGSQLALREIAGTLSRLGGTDSKIAMAILLGGALRMPTKGNPWPTTSKGTTR